MAITSSSTERFNAFLSDAAQALRSGQLAQAHDSLLAAVALNVDAPEPHNLLGIYHELSGNDSRACKHYRAAYALDPTYRPACSNLERIAFSPIGVKLVSFDYGDE